MNGFDPAGFNSRNQGWMRVQCPVLADLAFQAKLFPVGRQEQLNGGSIEPDAVI